VGVVLFWLAVMPENPALGLCMLPCWLLLCGAVGLGTENLVVWLAVFHFNRRFRQDAAERAAALALMRRWQSPFPAAQKIRLALGLGGPESAPEGQIKAALDQLAQAAAATTTPSAVQADPSPLPLGPSPISPGKKAPHPADSAREGLIPLDLCDRPGAAEPKPAADDRPPYLPIETLDNRAEGGDPQAP
jgi:hypothetical protein